MAGVLGAAVVFIWKLFQIGKVVSKGVVARLLLLWRGGIWTLIGVTFFVFAVHRGDILILFQTGDMTPLFSSLANELGNSYLNILAGAGELKAATGWEYVSVLAGIGSAFLHIIWYFVAVMFVALKINPTESPVVVVGLASLAFLALAWNVTGSVPVFSDMDTLANLADVVDLSRLNPFADHNTTVQAANQSLNATTR